VLQGQSFPLHQLAVVGCALLAAVGGVQAQDSLQVRPAESATIPLVIDSNTPMFWRGGELHLFTSTGEPWLSTLGEEVRSQEVSIDSTDHFPMWIESVWSDGAGTLYGWYHYERAGVCADSDLHSPEIGALISRDGGKSFTDLGIVLKSGDGDDCSSKNGYFAGGHGDFSVIPGREGRYFYFLFDNYGGPAQGVAMARMAAEDLASPVGKVWKWRDGDWTEPGVGGKVTPIFPAVANWQAEETDAFWGPSVHWNSYLEKYVVLMNRSCCSSGWPQEGVYLSWNVDLENPMGWTAPAKILETGDWYPWAQGLDAGQTSSEGGKVMRLWVRNYSEWEIVFRRDGEEPEPAPPPEPVDAKAP
jgi:hypothetical protein